MLTVVWKRPVPGADTGLGGLDQTWSFSLWSLPFSKCQRQVQAQDKP